jgi:hypothetical protein
VALAATVTLGVAPLLFVQVLYGRLFFSASVLMAWPWFLIVPLLIVAYYGAYLRAFRGESLGGLGPIVGWGSALIFLIIGFLYSNNMSLMLRPEVFRAVYLVEDRGLHLNLDDATLLPRFLHFLFGAIAVAGMFVVVQGLLRRRSEPDYAAWSIRYGAHWFVAATVISMGLGIWWLVALPRETMMRFMGGSTAATVILGLGILLSLVVLVLMAMAMMATRPEGLASTSVVLLLVLLVTMILNRDQVRRAALKAAGFEPVTWVEPQWGPILVFTVLLVAALAIVAWMVTALARGTGAGESAGQTLR